jgi:hypothetical protein
VAARRPDPDGKVSVRDMVLRVFGDNEHALCSHAEAVARWMRSAHEADDDEFVGG